LLHDAPPWPDAPAVFSFSCSLPAAPASPPATPAAPADVPAAPAETPAAPAPPDAPPDVPPAPPPPHPLKAIRLSQGSTQTPSPWRSWSFEQTWVVGQSASREQRVSSSQAADANAASAMAAKALNNPRQRRRAEAGMGASATRPGRPGESGNSLRLFRNRRRTPASRSIPWRLDRLADRRNQRKILASVVTTSVPSRPSRGTGWSSGGWSRGRPRSRAPR
jgi:hypothetical protein